VKDTNPQSSRGLPEPHNKNWEEDMVRGFAVFFLFIGALPAYVIMCAKAVLMPPRLPRPNPEVGTALTAEQFNEYVVNSEAAVSVVKQALGTTWVAGIVLAVVFHPLFLAVPVFTTVVFLSWYFQLSHQIGLAGYQMLARSYLNLWVATLNEASNVVGSDPSLQASFTRLRKAVKENDIIELEALKGSTSAANWFVLTQANSMAMGQPETDD
jgi:hypothetical protein